ncbi:hypothetical protein YC2023_049549 [Brassica napus]
MDPRIPCSQSTGYMGLLHSQQGSVYPLRTARKVHYGPLSMATKEYRIRPDWFFRYDLQTQLLRLVAVGSILKQSYKPYLETVTTRIRKLPHPKPQPPHLNQWGSSDRLTIKTDFANTFMGVKNVFTNYRSRGQSAHQQIINHLIYN